MRNLKALEAYVAVARLGSVTAAARHLRMSQPSVSRMVQELERELEQPLFERVGQRLVLTRLGLLLRDDAERALDTVSGVLERARALPREDCRPVRVAAVSSVAVGLLPHAIRLMPEELRRELVVESAAPEEVRNAVRSGAAEIGAGSLPLEHRDLSLRWMGSAPAVLAVPQGDVLARRSTPVALAELRGRRLLGLRNPRGLPLRIRRALAGAGAEEPSVRSNASVNLLSLVRAGVGLAVIDPLTPAGLALDGVTLLPLEEEIPYFIGVVTPAAGMPCTRGEALIEALREAALTRVPGFALAPSGSHQEILARMALLETAP